ncbi:MAG: DEAD/DEAH box helicase [Vicingaceae bacterium]
MSNFKQLGISQDLIKAMAEIGIQTPTEVQLKTIPKLLEDNTDFVVQSPTGTGKTAAFGLPIISNINPSNPKVQALILTPTRELGIQISKQLFKFTKYLPEKIFTEAVYGGEHIAKQMKALKRPTHIIVATPGRLMDLCQRKVVDLSKVKTVVLDEADEMLSMGFRKEVDFILNLTKSQRNTWMFSATMPAEILDLVKTHFKKETQRIQIEKKNVVNKNIEHRYVICDIEEKTNLIFQFLRARPDQRGVIFCRTKKGAQRLASQLKAKNIRTNAIEGDLQQKERDKVMRAFVNKNIDVLVATDVAARGIDVKDLSYVIHHQLPEKEEYYTHRSGRTARAGKEGVSMALITPSEEQYIKSLGKKLGIMIRPM